MRPWIENTSERFAERFVPGPNTVCISISEGHDSPLASTYDALLRMRFIDADDHQESAIRIYGHKMITEIQAKEIADFVIEHRGKNMLVHCAAGISRSRGVVEAVLSAFPEYEDTTPYPMASDGQPFGHHPNNRVKRLILDALVPTATNP